MEQSDTDATVVRQQHFECSGPVEVAVELGAGRLDIRVGEDRDTGPGRDAGEAGSTAGDAPRELAVQVRADPAAGPPWSAGITGLLSWLGEQAGASQPGELAGEAVRRTVIDFTGHRLTVRAPQNVPLRTVPLVIEVNAPAGSSVIARSGSADITVDGSVDRLDASTESGQVRAQRCTGPLEVRTGSGDVRVGAVLGTLRVRTGSGTVDVVTLESAASEPARPEPAASEHAASEHAASEPAASEPAASEPAEPEPAVSESESTRGNGGTVHTGAGDVRFGSVGCDLTARTGSGDVVVLDASAGRLDLTSGSGKLRVGIHPGVWAELDVSSGSGRADSELPVTDRPAEGEAPLRVKGRTGSGDALITPAPA